MEYPNNTRVLWFIKDFSTGTRVFGGYGQTRPHGTMSTVFSLKKIPVVGEDSILRLIDPEDVVLATKWHIKNKISIKGSRLPYNPF